MKRPFKTLLSFCCLFLVALACTKDVGLITEVEFELLEEHTQDGFVNQGLPTTFTIVPEEILENYEYNISYEILQGNGYFEDVEGNIWETGTGKGLPVSSPLTTSLLYMGTEVGEHRVKIVGEDNFGISEEIEIFYSLKNVPVRWEASSALTEIELGKDAELSLLFELLNTALDVSYEARFEPASGSGTLSPLEADGYTLGGEYATIAPGTYPFVFTPSELGPQQLVFILRDSNGQEIREELAFNVVENIRVISIFLGDDDTIEMQLGDEIAPDITFDPPNATDQGITLVSSDPDVVLIDENNVCIAVGLGTAVVTVTSTANPEATDTVTVTVVEPDRIPVTSIVISQEDPEAQGAVRQLIATVLPEDATDRSVTWASSDTAIATIGENGLLTGLTAGSVTITATSVSDPEVGDDITVEITGGSLQNGSDITAFELPGQNGSDLDPATHTITVNVTDGTELNVAPSALSISGGATIAPGIADIQDFNTPVTYTVTSGDGTQQPWTVNVTVSPATGSAENDITDFAIAGQVPPFTIDATAHTIAVTVAEGTDLNVAPEVLVISDSATIVPAIEAIQDFSGPVEYTVTADNGDVQIWTINVTVSPPVVGGETNITIFELPGQNSSVIDIANQTVTVNMTEGVNLNVAPQVLEVSPGSTVDPVPNQIQDFSSPVQYSVRSGSGDQISLKEWTINVTVSPLGGSTANDITAFELPVQNTTVIDDVNHIISVNVPDGTVLSGIAPSDLDISVLATVSPLISVTQDFNAAVEYTVTAENGTPQIWTINTTVAANQPPVANDDFAGVASGQTVRIDVIANDTDPDTPKPQLEIAGVIGVQPANAGSFSIDGQELVFTSSGDYTGDATFGYTINDGNVGNDDSAIVTVTISEIEILIAGIVLSPTELTIDIGQTGQLNAEVSPGNPTNPLIDWASSAPNIATVNGNGEVTAVGDGVATITASSNDSGDVEAIANVTVSLAGSAANDIIAFGIAGQTGQSIINNTAHTVTVEVPFGANLNTSPSSFSVSPGASVNPGETSQQDFSDPIEYTVTAENDDVQIWEVTVNVGADTRRDENDITAFAITGQTGPSVIDDTAHTVIVEVPFGTNLNTTPIAFAISNNATVNPLGTSQQNFLTPVQYTVTAENSDVQIWEVTVNVGADTRSGANDITAFAIPGQIGQPVINNTDHTIMVDVPFGTNLNTSPTSFSVSPAATVNPAGTSQQNFLNPVQYTVTAENTDEQVWEVTVNVGSDTRSGANNITAFAINGQTGQSVIDNAAHTVTVEVPFGTNLNTTPIAFSISDNATVNPVGTSQQNFLTPVQYTVTAENTDEQVWEVTVNVGADTRSPLNDIVQFTLSPTSGDATIDIVKHTATISVPFGTDLLVAPTNLVVSPNATVSPLGNVEQDFSSDIIYAVTAENGDSQDWTVIVNVAGSPANDITQFTLSPTSGDAVINTTNHTATISVPFGTDLLVAPTNLVVSPNATVSPLGNVEQDFSSDVIYAVTAENGDRQDWTVIVNVDAGSSDNDITQFTLSPTSGDAVINTTNHTATISVPFGTDLLVAPTNLVVSLGATVSPLGNVEQNFSSTVIYTVTAQNNATQDWRVTVYVDPPPQTVTFSDGSSVNPGAAGTTAEGTLTISPGPDVEFDLRVNSGTNATEETDLIFTVDGTPWTVSVGPGGGERTLRTTPIPAGIYIYRLELVLRTSGDGNGSVIAIIQ